MQPPEPRTRNAIRYLFVTDRAPGRLGVAPEEPRADHIGWRLVAANNRELGRSALLYDDLESCVEAVSTLHVDHARADGTLAFRADLGEWRWAVALDGSPHAVSPRPYKRRIECARALRQFFDAVASTSPQVSELRPLGSYSLRTTAVASGPQETRRPLLDYPPR